MKLPLKLPLDVSVSRAMRLQRYPSGFCYPRVLQIEVLDEAEATAVTEFLGRIRAEMQS